MFLLLCAPQLLDWQIPEGDKAVGIAEQGLLSCGSANAHSMFLLLPQLLDWFLFSLMAAVLLSNFLWFAYRRPAQIPKNF